MRCNSRSQSSQKFSGHLYSKHSLKTSMTFIESGFLYIPLSYGYYTKNLAYKREFIDSGCMDKHPCK